MTRRPIVTGAISCLVVLSLHPFDASRVAAADGVTCPGESAAIVGTDGADHLVGTRSPYLTNLVECGRRQDLSRSAAGLEISKESLAADATVGDVRIEAHFTDVTLQTFDPTIIDHIIWLMDNTPAGADIRIAMCILKAPRIRDAIIRAKNRGANVYYVDNGGENPRPDGITLPQDVKNVLGPTMHFCNVKDQYNGCVATDLGSFMHSKLMLISQTRDRAGNPRQWVSWFGSANFSPGSGGSMYNNTVTVYNDRTLYDAFNQNYYRYLWTEQHFPDDDFYRPVERRGHASSTASNIEAFASPSATHDLILDNLSKIIPDLTCRIAVGQASFQDSRLNVARKLAELKRRGCTVRALLGRVPKAIGPRALEILREARIPVRFNGTHEKNFLVYAKYGSSPNRNRGIVFTGSHNLNAGANSNLDELFVKIVNDSLYTAFRAAWKRQWDSGAPSVSTAQVRPGTREPVDGQTDWEEYLDAQR